MPTCKPQLRSDKGACRYSLGPQALFKAPCRKTELAWNMDLPLRAHTETQGEKNFGLEENKRKEKPPKGPSVPVISGLRRQTTQIFPFHGLTTRSLCSPGTCPTHLNCRFSFFAFECFDCSLQSSKIADGNTKIWQYYLPSMAMHWAKAKYEGKLRFCTSAHPEFGPILGEVASWLSHVSVFI